MKIPVVDGPQVSTRPVGTQYSNQNFDTGMAEVGRGFGQLQQGVDQAQHTARLQQDAQDKAAAKARKEADDFRVDAADLEFGHEINHGLHEKDAGFLNKQAEAALDETPTLEAFGKAKERISKGLANDEQRRVFNLKAQARMDQAWGRIESHVSEQRLKVYQGVSDGQVGLALDTVALSGPDTQAVDSAIGKVLVGPDGGPGPLRRYLLKRGLPAEKIQEEETAFQAKAYGVAMQGFLDRKDPDGATAYFDRVKGKLGPAAGKFEKDIGLVRLDQKADLAAANIVSASRNADGSFDATAAYHRVETLGEYFGPGNPGDRNLADEVRARVQKREMVEDRVRKDYVKAVGDQAYGQYNRGGFSSIPGPLKEELNRVDPKLYDDLRNDSRQRWRQLHRDDADARREQAKLNIIARNDFLALPDAEQDATDIDRFLLGRGVDEAGRSALGPLQKRAKDRVRDGASVPQADFVKDVTDAASGIAKKGADTKDLQAEANLAFDEFVQKNKRKPDQREAKEMLVDLVKSRFEKKSFLGIDYTSDQGPAYRQLAKDRREGAKAPPPKGEGPTPTGKTKKGADGTVWEEMSDGSARRKQ